MKRLNWATLLLTMWAGFWVLNSGDKLLNGSWEPMMERGVTSHAVVSDGEVIATLQPYHSKGGYGVNRDTKMEIFFGRIGLPKWTSQIALYGTAFMELVVALYFLTSLVMVLIDFRYQHNNQVYISNHSHMMAGMIFVMFIFGDILFGERVELWEHCCFLCTVILSNWQVERTILRAHGKGPA